VKNLDDSFLVIRRRYENKSTSPQTRRAIANSLNIWEAYLRRHDKTPAQATVDDVVAWRDAMLEGRESFRKLTPATVSLRLSIVRTFYGLAVDEGLLTFNPASVGRVPPPKLPENSRTVALEVRDVRRMLAAPDKTTLKGLRDAVILNLLARLALRRAEVCSLKNRDVVRLDTKTPEGREIVWGLRVTVKGGRERLLPLPTDVKDLIDEYRRLDDGNRRSLRTHLGESPLVQAIGGGRLQSSGAISGETVRRTVIQYAEYCGIKNAAQALGEGGARGKQAGVTPHRFRHTAVTIALDQGISLRNVMSMTGHRNIATLQRYDSNKNTVERNAINELDFGKK
jgi:site-specific recombinase XerD